jgi:molecular chaperone GrpE
VAEVEDVANAEPGRPAGAHWWLADEEELDLLRRERADFLNYKRRVERERAQDREQARVELLRQLLPIVDDLDRALGHLPEDLAAHPWAQGISLSHRRFGDALRELGLERLGADGETFDPTQHEAVAYEDSGDAAGQRVVSVLVPGYRVGSHLLRPAQVVVAGPPRRRKARLANPRPASGR